MQKLTKVGKAGKSGKVKQDAKGRKGAKGKNGAKGKKGKKGKKKKSVKKGTSVVIEERPPTPPSIAYIDKFAFKNENDFFSCIARAKIKKPTYVLFFAKESDMEKQAFKEKSPNHFIDDEDDEFLPISFADEEWVEQRSEEIVEESLTEPPPKHEQAKGKKRDPDEPLEVNQWMEECLVGMQHHPLSQDITFITVPITPKQVQKSYAYFHPSVQLHVLPTIISWRSKARLEGEECIDERLLCLFIYRENMRNITTYIDDGSICPFYTPPVPEPPPTPPKPQQKKKKGKGKQKKGKGKRKKEKAKQKGKGKGKKVMKKKKMK